MKNASGDFLCLVLNRLALRKALLTPCPLPTKGPRKMPAEKSCTRQTLSSKPFYRAKMPSIATPVVHGNRPAGRMPPSWMTALGGRGEAQSALLAFGGHETGPAVYRRLSARSGYAFDRLVCNFEGPGQCFTVRKGEKSFSALGKRFQADPFIGQKCPRLQPPSSMGTARRVECRQAG
jgi:hypothetical protein